MNEELLRRGPVVFDIPIADIGDVANAIEIAVDRFNLLAARCRRQVAGSIEKRLPGFEMAGVEGPRVAAALGYFRRLKITLQHAAPFGKRLEILAGDFARAEQFGIGAGCEWRRACPGAE